MVTTTRYSVIFQKNPSRVRVAQNIPSSVRVASTRWGLVVVDRGASVNSNRWRPLCVYSGDRVYELGFL